MTTVYWMLCWPWNVCQALYEALSLRMAYWQRKAIKCDLCNNLSWGGFQHDDGRWTCCACCECGTEKTPPWSNRHKEPLHVNWLMLEPAEDEEFTAKHYCPACDDGMLIMMRSSETGELLAHDICTLCGQVVIYDDIEFVKKIRR